MTFFIANRAERQILTLEGSVTIREARNLAALLNDSLVEGAPLDIETARLDDIDTCILQLLCSLKKTAPEFTFVDTSAVFLSAVDRSQLRRALLGVRENL